MKTDYRRRKSKTKKSLTLPEPRKPVIIVAGIRLSGVSSVGTSKGSSVSTTASEVAEAEAENDFRRLSE